MSIVAVAGGTGKLGRAVVDGIVADGKFEVVVLAREAEDAKSKEIGARIVAGAARSSTTMRYIPSVWGVPGTEDVYYRLILSNSRYQPKVSQSFGSYDARVDCCNNHLVR
ncbi:hypothetical protein WAI453_012084 [Rhynchosporium graminicola]